MPTPITRALVDRFLANVALAPGDRARFVRTGVFQTLSSLNPLRERLEAAVTANESLDWDAFAPIVARISIEKQQKYSVALKALQKEIKGDGTHIFRSLQNWGVVKLSKSQQRFTLPMLAADFWVTAGQRRNADHGLCRNMTMLWLKEQLALAPPAVTAFPRLHGTNVVGAPAAYAVTKKAVKLSPEPDAMAASLGLRMTSIGRRLLGLSFDNTADTLTRMADLRALFIGFYDMQHAIGFFRAPAGRIHFYDANAGSYDVPLGSLRNFLLEYNNICLPRKWPAYNQAATFPFGAVYEVARAPGT